MLDAENHLHYSVVETLACDSPTEVDKLLDALTSQFEYDPGLGARRIEVAVDIDALTSQLYPSG